MTSDPVLSWLLKGPPWLRRRAHIDLMGEDPHSRKMEQLRREGLADPPVARWPEELQTWPGPPLKGHKTLNLLIRKLAFLADTGLDHQDQASKNVVTTILESASSEGPFQIPILIPRAFGGSGETESARILCRRTGGGRGPGGHVSGGTPRSQEGGRVSCRTGEEERLALRDNPEPAGNRNTLRCTISPHLRLMPVADTLRDQFTDRPRSSISVTKKAITVDYLHYETSLGNRKLSGDVQPAKSVKEY